jgi:hypothetical protein
MSDPKISGKIVEFLLFERDPDPAMMRNLPDVFIESRNPAVLLTSMLQKIDSLVNIYGTGSL